MKQAVLQEEHPLAVGKKEWKVSYLFLKPLSLTTKEQKTEGRLSFEKDISFALSW